MHLINLTLAHYRGVIVLTGPSLADAQAQSASNISKPPHALHITLLTAVEYKSLGRPSLSSISESLSIKNIYAVGAAHSPDGRVSWMVVIWNHGDIWRRAHGLGRKEYHITLSEGDQHSLHKGVRSLLKDISVEELVERMKGLGEEAMDHTIVACGTESAGLDNALARQLAERMITTFPASYKGYARLADTTSHSNPKVSSLAYAQALRINPPLVSIILSRLNKLSAETSWGPMVTSRELDSIPVDLRPFLLSARRDKDALDQAWPDSLLSSQQPVLWTSPTISRDRQLYLGQYSLPRFFSWLYPYRLAGMSTPRSEADIDLLITMGFTHVLTLTQESPLPSIWFRFKSITHLYIPLDNYAVPTDAEMDLVYDRVKEGGTWLIHCGGGVGRAGTVLACLIAMFGEKMGEESEDQPKMDAKTAITVLRHIRPRSLESEIQERFVTTWISHRWKLLHSSTLIEEPFTSLIVTPPARIELSKATALYLIGKPGSGKSWLASSISKRRMRGTTIIISQDDSGSRSACERQFGRSYSADTLLILDRCNPQASDRKSWLDLVSDRQRIAVYFDYDTELCQIRLDRRVGHPTLRAGRGTNALEQMSREMERPTLEEGFDFIVTVSSLTAAREAVQRLTLPVPLLKFPRTAHLYNLGAVTSDDLVLDSDDTLLQGNLVIEEKIDGANMGISLDYGGRIVCQNRSHWVCSASHAQFRKLDKWLQDHSEDLQKVLDRDPQLPERYILYGEWMFAKHSIYYTSLPAPFIAFDLYDRVEGTFVSRRLLTSALRGTSIVQVPLILETDSISKADLIACLQEKSRFGEERIEGVYVRWEDERRSETIRRGKVVRGDFIVGNEHWAKGNLVLNTYRIDGEG